MRVLLFALILTHLACDSFFSNKDSTAKDEDKKDPIEVFIHQVEQSTLFEPLVFAGSAEPVHKRGLYAKVGGVVSKIYLRLGDKVKKNQKIMEITPKDINYKPMTIVSPMEGYLTESPIREGDQLSLNQKAAVVARLDKFETTIQASLKDLSFLKVGQKLHVVLAEYTRMQQDITGTIREISPVADPQTGTFTVRLDIHCGVDHPCYESLKAGTYVKVTLKKNLRKGIKIPLRYLREENKKALLLNDKGEAFRVEVTLGKNYGDTAEVLKGLSVGDKIITSYSKEPKDGEKVVVVEKKS